MNQFELDLRNRNIQRTKNIFNNIEKGENNALSKEEFEELQKSNEVYTPDAVSAFVNDLKKGLEADEITKEDYDAAMGDLKKMNVVRVFNGVNPVKVFFAKAIEVEAAQEEGDTTVGKKKENLEKGEKEAEVVDDAGSEEEENQE